MRLAPAIGPVLRRTLVAGCVVHHYLASVPCCALAAQSPTGRGPGSFDAVWVPVSESSFSASRKRTDIAGTYAVLRLNKLALDALLARAPLEDTRPASAMVVIELPLPDGRFTRFRVEESPMLAPELAAAFPGFKTYRGGGIDDPTATTRFGWTDAGFHAVIIASGGSVYIDPYSSGDVTTYVSYRESDLRRKTKDGLPR